MQGQRVSSLVGAEHRRYTSGFALRAGSRQSVVSSARGRVAKAGTERVFLEFVSAELLLLLLLLLLLGGEVGEREFDGRRRHARLGSSGGSGCESRSLRLSLPGGLCLASGNLLRAVAEDVGRLDVLQVDIEALAQDFDLKLEVELEFGKLVQLDEEAKDGHQPRVGRAEDARLGALLEDLADERDRHDEAVRVVTFDQKLLERNVRVLDRLVLGEREAAEPRAEVLEQSTLGRGLDRLVGIEEGREFDKRLVQDALDERRHLERLEELLVELVVVRLDRDSLRDEVVREPGKVDGLDPVEHVLDLVLKVGRREIVDDEQNLVRRLLVRRVRVASVLFDANRRKGMTFRLERLLLSGRGLERVADHAPDVDASRGGPTASVLLTLEERLTRNVGDVGVELLNVRDRKDGVRELGPLAEARLEPREGLDSEAEPVRVGRVAQSVEHVADGDT